ncbi:MAG TPA: CBS domain-containing protein [Polyangia bacterium]
MKVHDVMHAGSVLTVGPKETLGLATQLMVWSGIRHLPVVRDKAVIGILTEKDILRRSAEVSPRVATQQYVEDVMTAPALTVGPDEPVVNAITLIISRRIGCLPVVDGNDLVGIITTTDVLRNDLETALERPLLDRPPPLRAIMKRPSPVKPHTSVFDAAVLMSTRSIRHLPVVNEAGEVVGIVSDRDLRTSFGDPRRYLAEVAQSPGNPAPPVRDVMSKIVITLNQNEPMTAAIDRFVQDGIGALPIVDDRRRLVGMVSYLDIIQALR